MNATDRRPRPTTPNPVRLESRGDSVRAAASWLRSFVAGDDRRSPQHLAGRDIIDRLEEFAAKADREQPVKTFDEVMRKAEAVRQHLEAVLVLAVPDEADRADLWRRYWAGLVAAELGVEVSDRG